MSLREQRNKTASAILEGKFIAQTLLNESKDIDADINKSMHQADFKSDFGRISLSA